MDIFTNLKAFIKPQSCVIDNHVFKFHYKYTVTILVAFSIMISARQYFGDPIDCITKDAIPNDLLDTFCWIETTFSLEDAWHKKVGQEVPYPGIDKSTGDDGKVYHAYYQWVCFVLFFQALCFYFPRYLWKAFEGGRCKSLILGLNTPIVDEDKRTQNINLICTYLERNARNHNFSFYFYTFTEFLNFFNVLLQMYVIDKFLGGEFLTYGWEVLSFTEWDYSLRFDPMMKIFPRLTKCSFYQYGPSGDVQKHDAMCILPVNILNEKIYIFLWFWFFFVFIVSFISLIYRIFTILFPRTRILAIRSRSRLVNPNELDQVIDKVSLGDWFLFDLLCKNIDPLHFRELISQYNATVIEKKSEP